MKALLLALIPGFTLMTSALPAAEMTAATRRIDELLARGWQKHHLEPHVPVGDDVFLRRVYLTVVGRIPTLEEARCFLAWQEPHKREKLIDSLLASEGYVHHFFNYWADVFRAQSQGVADSTTAQNYLNYLRQALRDNKPYDQLARELVSSEGACFENGAIGYYMRDRGMPLDNLSNTTRIFLGTRMECAQCHDHPFDKWTQKQFYEMAAFTHNMTASAYRSPGADSLVTLVNPEPDGINWTAREREKRELNNRRQLAGLLDLTEAPLLFEASKQVAAAMREQNKEFDQLRQELDVARAKDDKAKAKEIQRRLGESQRILRQTVSRCFYEAAKKSNNKEVKAKLAEVGGEGPMEMAMMNLMESARVEAGDMPGEVMDMTQVQADAKRVGIQDKKTLKSYENYRKNLHQTWSRAAELTSPAPRGHFLREYGQSDRDVIENASDEASVPQALAMLNSTQVSQITGGWSALAMNLRQAKTADEKLEVLYLSIFSRLPTPQEKDAMRQRLESYASSKTLWEDMALAALSTQQFLFVR